MKFSLQQKKLSHLNVQRNALLGLSSLLLVIVLLQTIFLFLKKDRIIVSPPDAKQSYWVEGNRFSPSYLEEMSLFMCHLLLDITQSNIFSQGEILLRYISPKAYGEFKTKLLEDEKRLQHEQLSLHFMPQEVVLSPESLTVDITGDLISYVSTQKISQVRETYRLVFEHKLGRLFLQSFKMVKSDKENANENS